MFPTESFPHSTLIIHTKVMQPIISTNYQPLAMLSSGVVHGMVSHLGQKWCLMWIVEPCLLYYVIQCHIFCQTE